MLVPSLSPSIPESCNSAHALLPGGVLLAFRAERSTHMGRI